MADTGRQLPVGTTVLFQGDSITDASRNRHIATANSAAALGTGYPNLLASTLLRAYPQHGLRFLNRGVGGNRVPDLQARWEVDTLTIEPTIVSVLVGVNDFWHKRLRGYTGTVADYEEQYIALLTATRERLPYAQIIVMEPFVLRVGVVDDTWFPEFDARRTAAARVAQQSGATFVPLQEQLSAVAARDNGVGGPGYWTEDGVHPTPAGHALIAECWRKVVGV